MKIHLLTERATPQQITEMLEELQTYIKLAIDVERGIVAGDGELPDRVDDTARLVEIQRGLTHWYHAWNEAQHDPAQRPKLAEQARVWSDEVLAMSGLPDQE